MVQDEPYLKAIVTELYEEKPDRGDEQFIALVDSIKDIALQIVKESPNIPSEAQLAIQNIESPTYLVNFVCSNMDVDMNKKQELLEVFNLKTRSEKTLEIISIE